MEGLRNNKLAEDLLHLALAQGASDLHIEPDGQGVRVRIRVDGLLQQLCVLPHSQQSTLLTQLKVWSGMDIAEKRVPQDGRLLLEHEGSEVDLRLSSLPTVNGEKLAIRFLQRQDNLLQLEQLQFSDDNLQRCECGSTHSCCSRPSTRMRTRTPCPSGSMCKSLAP